MPDEQHPDNFDKGLSGARKTWKVVKTLFYAVLSLAGLAITAAIVYALVVGGMYVVDAVKNFFNI